MVDQCSDSILSSVKAKKADAAALATARQGLQSAADAVHAAWKAGQLSTQSGEVCGVMWSLQLALEALKRLQLQQGDSHRGHLMIQREGVWVYQDNGAPVEADPNRACGSCGLENTSDGHDGCLGTLPGVFNACCGHGQESDAYVQFDGGEFLRGHQALSWVDESRHQPFLRYEPAVLSGLKSGGDL